MKTTKILLYVFFVMLSGSTIYSQEFAPIGSKWTYQSLGLGSNAMGFPVAYQFKTEKDTIINNRYCTVITGYNLYEDGRWEQIGSQIVAASEKGDTVYVYFQDSFHLIYDFTAAVGDTIEVTNEKFDGLFRQSSIQQNQFIYKIDSILSVPFNLDTLLIQYVSYLSPPEVGTPEWGFGDGLDIASNTPDRIIKGIGALNRAAPLGTSSDIFYFPEGMPDYLNCYEDENRYYQFGDLDCDSLVTTIAKDTLDCRLLDLEGQWNIYQPNRLTTTDNTNQKIDATAIYFYNGDTIINNQTYQKVYQTDQPVVDLASPNNQYAGVTREEGQQVYFLPPNQTEEVLLYDFDLAVGDTMLVEKFEMDFFEFIEVIVESIDSVQTLDQQIRKRINFSIYKEGRDTVPQYFTSWIEGIGDIGIGGLLETHADGRILFGFFDLRNGDDYTSNFQCFSKNEELVYQSDRFEYCRIHTGYIPFPVENGVWRTLESRSDNYAPNVFGSIERTRTYFMYGDTMMAPDQTFLRFYHKLYTTQADTIPTQPRADQYIGAFREKNKVIYFYDKSADQERILYDFNIEVGDTITTLYDDVATEYTIFLGKIDTIQTLDNQFRKRYELRIADNLIHNTLDFAFPTFTYWIEGVGDVGFGLLSFPQLIKKDEFQCFSIGENLIYQNATLDNCFTDTASYTVDYAPLVVENATWFMASNTDVYAESIDFYAYKIQGDSVVNGVSYKKLFRYELALIGGGTYELISQQFQLLMREDTPSRKVYGYPSPTSDGNTTAEEFLMIDFSKTVGQSITYFDFKEGVSKTTEIIEDVVELWFNEDRRTLKTVDGILFFEGIGYYSGLLETPTPIILPTGDAPILISYCQGINFDCNILTSTTDPLPQKVAIYPNPAKDFLSLQFEQVFDGQIALHSLARQVVYQAAIQATSHEIMVGNLPKGVYFLHLQAAEGYLVQKIIVQ